MFGSGALRNLLLLISETHVIIFSGCYNCLEFSLELNFQALKLTSLLQKYIEKMMMSSTYLLLTREVWHIWWERSKSFSYFSYHIEYFPRVYERVFLIYKQYLVCYFSIYANHNCPARNRSVTHYFFFLEGVLLFCNVSQAFPLGITSWSSSFLSCV